MTNLYQAENEILEEFQAKIDNEEVFLEDVIEFKKKYESLANESQVLLKVSDRLQKKLDRANGKIKQKNDEISVKNASLKEAIDKLVQARVGKRASTIMFTATILLFVSEELYLGPLVEYFVDYAYLILLVKGGIALILKFLESILESHFVGGEKKKIVKESGKDREVKKTSDIATKVAKLSMANAPVRS